MQGRAAGEYGAPLFFAWQLTNRCGARCVACCEESGPDKAWRDELGREEALDLARRIVESGIPYVAFGGGEPLGVPHVWDVFDVLAAGGVALKLETDGTLIDEAAADRLAGLGVQCVQVSVDGANAVTHHRVRPGGRFEAVIAAIRRLVERGVAPQWVFVPTRWNLHEIGDAYDRASDLGCSTFVTGPLMRIGRAAANWAELACSDADWSRAVAELRQRAAAHRSPAALSVYPWDILAELEKRLESPQAMLLVVPNGKVKLLNALPFAPADLRRDSLEEAWLAYREAWGSREVRAFVAACRQDPGLLRHANETWSLKAAT